MIQLASVIPVAEMAAMATAFAGSVVSALSMWKTKSAVDHLSREISQKLDLTKMKSLLAQGPTDPPPSGEHPLGVMEQEIQSALNGLTKDERQIVEDTLKSRSAEARRRFLADLVEKGLRQQAS